MPAPTTAEELLDLLQKSNLVDEPRLRAYVDKLRAAGAFPPDPSKLAGALVRDALLTFFQAEQLLQGKYKRFSLGKYKVLEKLGAGGMGTVFLCEHKLMRRRVAVKVLPAPKSEDQASLSRFYREAKAAAAVDHPNIVRAYDIDQDDNLHFLVMEWVDGTNLQDLVKKFGPLDPVRASHYVYGTAVGLQHAHEIGLIHRDIKPGNILIDRSGVVKILDLGLARLTQDTDDQLTRQNDENVLGTADYLAPEQALDSHTVDIRADIYSLGATFYFLLSGSPPFPEGSVAQKLIWHQNRPPRPLKALRADVPDELAAVIERMMAKDPAARYQTPADVIRALAGWVSTPIPPPAERELPALSPAVAGGQGGNRAASPGSSAAASMVLAGPSTVRFSPSGSNTLAGMPTVIAAGATPIQTAPAVPLAAVPSAAAGVWANIDAETQTDTGGNTDRAGPADPLPDEDEEDRPSRVSRRAAAARSGKKKLLLFVLLGALSFVCVAISSYLAFGPKKNSDGGTSTPVPTPSHRIIVSRSGEEHTYKTLREALAKAGPGDTIVLTEPRLTEVALKIRGERYKDLIIESATPDGKPAVIEFAGTKGGVMFEALNVEGLHVRNVEFDGKGQAERGVQVSGIVPGTTFEGVVVRGVQLTGFYLWNVTGSADRPVTLDRVRVVLSPTTEGGVVSLATPENPNKHITIRNSRFEGPGKAGIRFDGATSDVAVSNNRFFNLNSAVSFVKPNGKPSKGTFTNNTTYLTAVGLLFEVPANDPTPFEFKVSQNYFASTAALIQAPGPVPGLTSEANLYDPKSGPGGPPLAAEKRDAPALPTPDQAEDATFLRFPANIAPTVGPNKVRVGAH
jgi:serine/threonine protein kinase